MKPKISLRQQGLVVFTALLAPLLLQTRPTGAGAQVTVLACVLAAPVLWLILLPAGRGLAPDGPVPCRAAFAAALAVSVACQLYQAQRFYSDTTETELSLFWYTVVVAAAVLYGAHAGLGGITRTANVFLWACGGGVLLLLVSVAGQLRVSSLQITASPLPQVWQALPARLLLLPEFLLPAWLAPTRRAGRNVTAAVLAGWALVAAGLAVLGEAVLGAGYADQSHPVYTVARLGGVSVFRRLDAVHVSIWMLLALLRLMLSSWALARLVRELLPTARSRWLLVPAGGALAALLGMCTAQQMEWVCGGLLAAALAAALLPKRRKTP